MTCRHDPHDPKCTSYASRLHDAQEFIATRQKIEGKTTTPDAENFRIEQVAAHGNHLVLRVRYPSCAACAYEGDKVMVFLNTTALDALRWTRIDPHFRELRADAPDRHAPPPDARFPANAVGWEDAVAYVERKMAEAAPCTGSSRSAP